MGIEMAERRVRDVLVATTYPGTESPGRRQEKRIDLGRHLWVRRDWASLNRKTIMDACEPGCYLDEVFMPHFLGPLGLCLVRTKTLARKGDRCDLRYERV